MYGSIQVLSNKIGKTMVMVEPSKHEEPSAMLVPPRVVSNPQDGVDLGEIEGYSDLES